jgi:DNA-binding NtrC family response regulator
MSEKFCLIVDDDPSISITRLLRHWEHFEALEADGGRRALDIMKTLGNAVDLIVTNVQMPGGDGVSFAHSVRESFAEVPIILVSGNAQPPDALEFEFVEKPFAPDALLRVVRRVLAQKLKIT